jgi:antitoxin component HigA of HigAB toxin-antitoxin module
MARRKREEVPSVVEQLKEAIRGSGRSLNQLSINSGVSSAQLSRFMQGKRSLTLPAVEKLCRTLRLGLAPLPPEAPPTRRRRQAGQEGGAESN